MKKYILLLLCTVIVGGAVMGAGTFLSPQPVTVSLVTATEQQVRKTVECSGKVEAAGSTNVFAPIACVAGGLAGAYYGKENIPQEWVDGVAKSGWIREKAAEFQHKWLG